MHILQLVPRLEVGGVERGVLDLAKGLIARGHAASVVSSGGGLVDPLVQLGARHYLLPVHRKSPFILSGCVPEVCRIIKTTGVDIVHARSRVPAWIGWLAARITQKPFITTAHGFYKTHPMSRVMTWGRNVIAPSDALGRYLVEQFRLPKSRLRIIARGVDLDIFTFRPPTQQGGGIHPERYRHEGLWRVGLFGRLSSLKGHDVSIRACARLIQRGVPLKLCLAGNTPHSARQKSLRSLIRSLGIEPSVEWLGLQEDICSLIASVDIVIVPSTYPESFGRGVIEAQAVGRPVIASRIGALTEIIDHQKTGLLVAPGEPDALADAIERLINDKRLRDSCVRAARAKVESDWSVGRMVDKTLAVYEECLKKPSILVWKLSALGDVILSSPSLRALRKQFPDGHIALAVGRGAYEVVARCPYLNSVVIYDPARKDQGFSGHWKFLKRLRQESFDISVDLQNSQTTHLLAWLAGIPIRVGYRRKLGCLLNRAIKLPRETLAPIAHQHHLLLKAGFITDGEALEIWVSHSEKRSVGNLLRTGYAQEQRALIGLHPGGSRRWRTKRWSIEHWAKLCDQLTREGYRVVITGGGDERGLGAELVRLSSSNPLVVMGKTSIMELACLIERCAIFIAQDSAPLHLAAAVGTKTIALFGPTDSKRHLPPQFRGRVIEKEIFCRPCYSTYCRTITHACMKNITVGEVLSAVKELHASAAAQ